MGSFGHTALIAALTIREGIIHVAPHLTRLIPTIIADKRLAAKRAVDHLRFRRACARECAGEQ
jgi:hypothetical protein